MWTHSKEEGHILLKQRPKKPCAKKVKIKVVYIFKNATETVEISDGSL